MSECKYKNTNTARRAAVNKAWANERALVLQGKGTREWTESQQAEIISTGKCKGFVGHHKLSVKNYPEEAANPKNIQFLSYKEHLKAHDGNYKNDAHGRYDSDLGKISKYEDNKVHEEPIIKLKNTLSDSRKESSENKFALMKIQKAKLAKERAAKKAKSYEKRSIDKQVINKKNKSNRIRESKDLQNSKAKSMNESSKALRIGKTSLRGNLQKTSKTLSLTRSISQSKSTGVSQGKGIGVSQGKSAGIPQGASAGISQGTSGAKMGGNGGHSR